MQRPTVPANMGVVVYNTANVAVGPSENSDK